MTAANLAKLLAANGVAASSLPPGFGQVLGSLSPDAVEIMLSKRRPAMRCVDGTSLSVQAGASLYSIPKGNVGPYEAVEVGYPSARIPEIMNWAEAPDAPTRTVYGHVPLALIAIVVAARGGRDSSQEWRVSRMADRGAGELEKPAVAGTLRRVSPGDRDGAISALGEWMQAAALGSPWEEMAARFELGDESRTALDFAGCMAALAKMGPKRGRDLKGKPWAGLWAIDEVCAGWARAAMPRAEAVLIGGAARQAPRARRRVL